MAAKKLLIVEDHEDIAELIEESAEQYFEQIKLASNVDDATREIESNIFDCIILDINLGESNGGEIVKYLVEHPENHNNGAKIIISSGYVNDEFSQKHSSKFAAIIGKPFDCDKLAETLNKIASGEETSAKDNQVIKALSKPFDIPDLIKKTEKIVNKIKKNPKIEEFFKSVEIPDSDEKYVQIHIGMILNISTGISKKLGWYTEKTLEKFIYASYLHDVAIKDRPDLAMIQTPREFERAKDNLSPEDFELVVNHSKIAAEMVEPYSEIPTDVRTMIEQHHERPDGKGWPNALEGMRITPLSAVFIISHDLSHYIISNKKWKLKTFIEENRSIYRGANFKKVVFALEDLKGVK